MEIELHDEARLCCLKHNGFVLKDKAKPCCLKHNGFVIEDKVKPCCLKRNDAKAYAFEIKKAMLSKA